MKGALCPNRNRAKRVGPGGGKPLCQGRLAAVMVVPLMLPAKAIPKGADRAEKVLSARVLAKGVRIDGRTVYEAYRKRDIVCSACGWSLRAVEQGLRRRARGR